MWYYRRSESKFSAPNTISDYLVAVLCLFEHDASAKRVISYFGALQLTPDHAVNLFVDGRGGRAFVVRDADTSGEPLYSAYLDPTNRTWATWLKALFSTAELRALLEYKAADCLGDYVEAALGILYFAERYKLVRETFEVIGDPGPL